MIDEVLDYIDKNIEKSIEDVQTLCRIPSVAAKNEGIDEAADSVKKMLEGIGFDVELHKTSGSPVVVASLEVGAKRTLMFYDHYDVQPAEPFDLWDSPPFEPEIRNGRLYARGVADNKGDIVSRVWAIKAFLDTGAELPVNLKFVIEGEEEISSPHLHEYIEKNKDFLNADGGIWEFGGEDIDGFQEAWLGLKGILYVQLEVERLAMDAHSASACVLPSAAYRLIWALNSLKNQEERVLIEGFYNDAKDLSPVELDAISKTDMHEDKISAHYGIQEFLKGMKGDELKEAYYNAPTCNICGIESGWQGEGAKTVLPAKASAKLDFRLVETMDPNDIVSKLRNHLDKFGFSDIVIAWHKGYPAAKTPVDHPFVSIVKSANEKVFGHEIVIQPTSPGSGPLHLFKKHVPMVSIGCGDFDSRAHSPNESIKLDNYYKAVKRVAVVMDEMGRW
ncbi:MAG: M20/M25/M40 family metallo-hydrolase [Candidatus Thorarchaeota archaeon]|jgi:acetylornithine deacetylase/succinyl-diaminopimelate desuccinylase-like protein